MVSAEAKLPEEVDSEKAWDLDGCTPSDQGEVLWLISESNEVLAVPEVAVSWETASVGVCPLKKEEGVDVIPGNIGLV